jgi:ribosomal protein L29
MKIKDKKELFTKSEKELVKKLTESRQALFNLVLDNRQVKLKNTRSIFWKKKEIALILTSLKEKALLKVEGK